MRATNKRRTKYLNCRTYEWNFYSTPPLYRFDEVPICSGLDLVSNPGPERRTEFVVDCIFVKQSASILLVPTWTSLTSGRALHCCRKNAFNSMFFVLQFEPLHLIMPSAAEESQHRICCVVSFVSSAWHPHFSNQFHCCRRPMLSQAPQSAATNSASPLLSAVVDCFLLDAMIGNQPSLSFTHDALPLTLNRSASPAQSVQDFHEASPIAQRRSARTFYNSFPTSCRWTPRSLAGISFSSVSRCSHRSVGELLSADMLNSSNVLSTHAASTPMLYASFVFTRVRPR